jgi:hypothetical protein
VGLNSDADVENFASVFQPTKSLLDLTLCWKLYSPIEQIFPILERWRHLRRLRLVCEMRCAPKSNSFFDLSRSRKIRAVNFKFLDAGIIYDLILKMKNLTCLEIFQNIPCERMKVLENNVNVSVRPHRPDFLFKAGCLRERCCPKQKMSENKH